MSDFSVIVRFNENRKVFTETPFRLAQTCLMNEHMTISLVYVLCIDNNAYQFIS